MKSKRKIILRMLSYIRKQRLLMALSVVLAAASSLLVIYIPKLIGDSIDLAVEEGKVDMEGILSLLIKVAVIVVISAMTSWLMELCNNKVAFNLGRDLRYDSLKAIEKLPLSYIDSHASGDICSRVISDSEQVSEGVLLGFSQFFTGAVTILGTLGFMLYINWKVALLVIFLTPISLFAAAYISKKTYSMFKAQSEMRSKLYSYTDEMISGQKVVTAFNRQESTIDGFESINEDYERTSLKAIFFSSLTNPCTRFVNNIVYAVCALTGAFLVLASGGAALSVGGLSCFLSYANKYTKPFNEISGVIAELQNALACAGRVFELLDEPPQKPDAINAADNVNTQGNISLNNVYFSYTPERPLIQDLNLTVKPGQRVAIVGPTGCGKTTLINLLMRFYDIQSGSISVGDDSIYDISRKALRRSFGMVLQETWLKGGTIRDNIAMGKTDATDDEIYEAAKNSHAYSFIRRLPDGFNTVLQEGGEGLSKGQRQLLCIARVMLSIPPMLILDEATSSIDTRTEIKIQRAFNHMMQNRTSFIVAHRLSTIKEADIILVMKDGNIIEKGTHDSLLKAKGFYFDLYNSQFVILKK